MLYFASLTSESVVAKTTHSVIWLWVTGSTPVEKKLKQNPVQIKGFIKTEIIVLYVYIGGKISQHQLDSFVVEYLMLHTKQSQCALM